MDSWGGGHNNHWHFKDEAIVKQEGQGTVATLCHSENKAWGWDSKPRGLAPELAYDTALGVLQEGTSPLACRHGDSLPGNPVWQLPAFFWLWFCLWIQSLDHLLLFHARKTVLRQMSLRLQGHHPRQPRCWCPSSWARGEEMTLPGLLCVLSATPFVSPSARCFLLLIMLSACFLCCI